MPAWCRGTGSGALTWKKIVADEHAEQYKVVHDMLQTEREWQRRVLEFQLQIVSHKPGTQHAYDQCLDCIDDMIPWLLEASQHLTAREGKEWNAPNLKKNEMLCARIVQNLAGWLPLIAASKPYHLTQKGKSSHICSCLWAPKFDTSRGTCLLPDNRHQIARESSLMPK